MYDSLSTDENFDIQFTDDGLVDIKQDAESLVNMLRLDFISNNNWDLDSSLGINWINKDNNGLMQSKNPEILIVKEVKRKLESTEGISYVEEITINKKLDRSLSISATAIAYDGSSLSIESGVI